MNKRRFLAAAMGSLAVPALAYRPSPKSGPALLTVTGDVSPNRAPFDPALDQMMHKQNLSFDKAHTFNSHSLAALAQVTIKPTLEYDAKQHALAGPLLLDVLKAASARLTDTSTLVLRAVDGYAAALSVSEAQKYRFIVATHLDGAAMPLGGLGPLWAVYDADRFSETAAKPLNARFGSCPWALYHIEVSAR